MPEQELVERVLARERGAVAALVSRYERLVQRMVFRLVDDPRDREELCQNTFLHALRALPSFRGDARLATWIARIAHRECVRHLRRKRIPLVALDAAPDPDRLESRSDAPSDLVQRRELEEYVQNGVGLLEPSQKTVVTLFYLEDMSVARIASIMGVPENTVKSHLYRARQRLRTLLVEEARERGYST